MGKLGKETKVLLFEITAICFISFLLAVEISFMLAKNFQQELLIHDYGVAGYQLNHEDELQISAFTVHPDNSDVDRGKDALTSIGYSETVSMHVEAICLLSKLHSDQHIEVELKMDELDLTAAECKATY